MVAATVALTSVIKMNPDLGDWPEKFEFWDGTKYIKK
jgi:hypothetical protein